MLKVSVPPPVLAMFSVSLSVAPLAAVSDSDAGVTWAIGSVPPPGWITV